jgi:YHS domain-containing protein
LCTRNQILQRFLSNLCDAGDLERIKIRNADILEVKNPDDIGSKMIDGAVLLKIVLDKCSPSTLSKIDNVKSELSCMKMSDYNDNVEQLIDEFEAKVLMIEDMGGQVEEKFKYLFRALQTSTNDDFNQDIRTMRMKYYRGDGKSFDELTRAANDLYKNMVADDAWGKRSAKDLHIAALTTKLSHLTELTKALATSLDSSKKVQAEKEERPEWKFIFKGNSVEHNGRTYYWCSDPSHNKTKDQKEPGMYCQSHGAGSGITHEESRKKLAEKKKSANGSIRQTPVSESTTNEEQGKLALSDKLKAAISSHLTMSSEDLDSLFDEQVN